jgi:hypothetical protein
MALRFHSFGSLSSVLRIEEIRTPTAEDEGMPIEIKAEPSTPAMWTMFAAPFRKPLCRVRGAVIFPELY